MSQENVEIVRRANAAVNQGDLGALRDLLHPDIEWQDMQPRPGMDASGRGSSSAMHWIDEWRSAFDGFTAEVYEYIDLGDHVLCVTGWRGTGRQSGLLVEGSGLELYEVRDGKLVRAVMGLPDKAAALEAAGLSE